MTPGSWTPGGSISTFSIFPDVSRTVMVCVEPSWSSTCCVHSRGPATLDTMSHAASDDASTSTAAMVAMRVTTIRVAGMR